MAAGRSILPKVDAELYHCAVADLHKFVGRESIDVILTDPPYEKEYLSVYEGLRDFAIHALKPGGHLLAMSGHAWMRDLLNIMHCEDEAIRFQWMISQRVKGRNNGNLGRRICRISWKPILWYIKPPSNIHEQLPDELPPYGKDKRFHSWGQNVDEMRAYLHYLARGGGKVVCDPFVGGGTTGVAAQMSRCKFVGADIDADSIETTRERLLTTQQEFDFKTHPPLPPMEVANSAHKLGSRV